MGHVQQGEPKSGVKTRLPVVYCQILPEIERSDQAKSKTGVVKNSGNMSNPRPTNQPQAKYR